MQVNALLCHEAAELLLPQGFDDARMGLDAMLAPDEQGQHGQQQRGGLRDMALGCDEEMELEDGSGMLVVADSALEGGLQAGRRRAAQQLQQPAGMMAMAEPSAIRAAATGSGTLVRPPMGPQTTRAPLPMPPPPRALGRSQSLPAYHTSVYYGAGGAGGGFSVNALPPPPALAAPAARQEQEQEQQGQGPQQGLPPPPPPPPFLLRQRSFSCLSRPYRSTTGRFLSENLARVEEGAPREDVAERVVTMHAQERDYYAPPLAYFQRLETDALLAQWRRGAVRWFSKVVEHLHANREAIATATNFLDRHFGSCLYPSAANAGTPPNPLLPPPLLLDHDQAAFERAAACALALALKMHQGDSTASLAPRLAALTSCSLTPRALCALEFEMVGTLGRYLNPPTPGTLIHHLLHFLPADDEENNNNNSNNNNYYNGGGSKSSSNRPLLLALDDHANDLALMALETPSLVAFPVSVVAVAAILASFARLRADGANKWLDPTLELRWLQALDANDLKVEPDEITECLEQLGRQAKKAAAAPAPAPTPNGHSSGHGVNSPLAGVEGLYLPHYLNPPAAAERKPPATPGPNNGEGKMARALSPTGVDEIDAMLVMPGQPGQQQEGKKEEAEGMMEGVVA